MSFCKFAGRVGTVYSLQGTIIRLDTCVCCVWVVGDGVDAEYSPTSPHDSQGSRPPSQAKEVPPPAVGLSDSGDRCPGNSGILTIGLAWWLPVRLFVQQMCMSDYHVPEAPASPCPSLSRTCIWP